MIDQIRAIDNRRLTQKVGELPKDLQIRVKENVKLPLNAVLTVKILSKTEKGYFQETRSNYTDRVERSEIIKISN